MNCIFCQQDSSNSKSIEHIIPESLGNKHHILWKGAVCDKCNNYFATKIEKELLEQPYFVSTRQRNYIKSKKDKLVKDKIVFAHPQGGTKVEASINAVFEEGKSILQIQFENDELFDKMLKGEIPEIYMPYIPMLEPNNYLMSRFLTKCALEFFTFIMGKDNFLRFSSEVLEDKQFDPIRTYARYGESCNFWPYSQRRIYSEGSLFVDLKNRKKHIYQIINEMDFLSIEIKREKEGENEIILGEIYFVMAIMGIEYAINLAGPNIEGYYDWLKTHNNISPLRKEIEHQLDFNFPDLNPFIKMTE